MDRRPANPLRTRLLCAALTLVGIAGWGAFALALGRTPVVIATRRANADARIVAAPPVPCPGRPAASVSETYRGLEKLARLAARREWEQRVQDLKSELALESQRADAATAQLDAVRSPARSPTPALAPGGALPGERTPPPSATRRASRITAGAARVRLVGSDALVTGTLRNAGRRDATARLVVELLLDQRVIDRSRLRILVPARGSVPFSQTFATSLAEGTYAARVRFDR